MYYVYLLKSDKDDGIYIGFSGDLKRRLREHLNGCVDATKHRHPVRLLYCEAYELEEMARQRETNLKQSGSAYTGLLKRLREK